MRKQEEHQYSLFLEDSIPSEDIFIAYVRLSGQRRWHIACTGPDLWTCWRRVLQQTRPCSCDVIVLPMGETP